MRWGQRESVLVAALGMMGLVGCPSDDDGSGGGTEGGGGATAAEPAWRTIFDDGQLDRALLSVWGTGSSSVYAVGGPLKNSGREALALHYDGSVWKDLSAGGSDSFWWVHGTSDQDVWMVGEHGRITHFDGAAFEEHDSGTTATLWGAYAFAPDDAWAVGGMVGGPDTTPDDVVLHWNGSTWTQETLPGMPLGRALFKVWGPSPEELFVVGEAGVLWHKKAGAWSLESDPPIATGNLTTVHGCSASDVWAVGGRDLLHYDGVAWTKLEKGLGNDVNGVYCAIENQGLVGVVGMGGQKQRLVEGAWQDDFVKSPHGDLHATWFDETGAMWAVGGEFVGSPRPGEPRNGIVARFGPGRVTSKLE